MKVVSLVTLLVVLGAFSPTESYGCNWAKSTCYITSNFEFQHKNQKNQINQPRYARSAYGNCTGLNSPGSAFSNACTASWSAITANNPGAIGDYCFNTHSQYSSPA